jgi:hypothetical protein
VFVGQKPAAPTQVPHRPLGCLTTRSSASSSFWVLVNLVSAQMEPTASVILATFSCHHNHLVYITAFIIILRYGAAYNTVCIYAHQSRVRAPVPVNLTAAMSAPSPNRSQPDDCDAAHHRMLIRQQREARNMTTCTYPKNSVASMWTFP